MNLVGLWLVHRHMRYIQGRLVEKVMPVKAQIGS